MKLSEGKPAGKYVVLETELPLKLERRLEALGMTDGTEVRILHKKNSGSMVILLRGTRFAVGKGISENITVREAE